VKRSARSDARLKSLAELKSVRLARPEPVLPARRSQAPQQPRLQASVEFREAVRGVTPLLKAPPVPIVAPARPDPAQRERDDQAVLDESLSDQISIESLLDTDESLSYRSQGISAETLRKLRRGFWVVQGELDLHGHRVLEAHQALTAFLRDQMQQGRRCVRIVHGKGNRSRDGVPILKGKVRSWLARRSEVIAFCQARPPDGGAGALVVLLKPSTA
jgi:DNA-nicking Smr family endonuclease